MKSIITINFQRINRIKVDKSLLQKTPNLYKSTEKTLKILCEQIEKYFQDNKIEVKCSFRLDDE